MNIKNRLLLTACLSLSLLFAGNVEACTGITLVAKDSSRVVARTIEWGGSDLNSRYVIVPRGFEQQSYTPQGVNGMKFKARYGYVGLAVEQKRICCRRTERSGTVCRTVLFSRLRSLRIV